MSIIQHTWNGRRRIMRMASLLLVLISISAMLAQETPTKADPNVKPIPTDLKDWSLSIYLQEAGATDGLRETTTVHSDGMVTKKTGRGVRHEGTRAHFYAKLDSDDTRKVFDGVAQTINHRESTQSGKRGGVKQVFIKLSSGMDYWTFESAGLATLADAAPELKPVADVLERNLQEGTGILAAELKDWEIVLSMHAGTPGDRSFSEATLKSSGGLFVEVGRGRKERARSTSKGEGRLNAEDLQKALELAAAAIGNTKAWHDGRSEDGCWVLLSIKSGRRRWTEGAGNLNQPTDAAPEVRQLIEFLNRRIKNGTSILQEF